MSKKLGKIDHNLFENFIKYKCGAQQTDVLVKPGFGVDVSVVDLPGDYAMAITSDPLSLLPTLGLRESAWLSVHLMTNDMATTGFSPMYGQFVLNLPAKFSREDFKIYWNYIHEFCEEIGIAITGGHTGFIEGQNSTIAGGGTLITVAPKESILTVKNASAEDSILVTKTCGLSTAAILAMSFPETVKAKIGKEKHQEACDSFYQTSSLRDALVAVGNGSERLDITSIHDVTEGGVLGAIYELAVASENGAMVFNDKLPVNNLQKEICEIFSLDPRYCIGAGSMIITCRNGSARRVIDRLAKENIPCVEVGQLSEKEKGIKLRGDKGVEDLIYCEEDPYWEAFFKAFKAGFK
ncbi:MAG: AIR synthase family protein [Brumimicrobium sp.]|nr:AIR synthase family protein [Brumimicrobium sp.]